MPDINDVRRRTDRAAVRLVAAVLETGGPLSDLQDELTPYPGGTDLMELSAALDRLIAEASSLHAHALAYLRRSQAISSAELVRLTTAPCDGPSDGQLSLGLVPPEGEPC